MKKIIIIIALVIVGIAGGIFGYWYLTTPKPVVPFVHDPGDYFVTDIKGSKALLKADIMIQVGDDRLTEEITASNYKVRNDIIFILRGKTEEDLKTPGVEAALSQEIINKLNEEFGVTDFQKIYFNEFVIQ